MDPILIGAAVMVLVQGIKEVLAKWKVKIHGIDAVLITLAVCIGEVSTKVLDAKLPLLTLATAWLLLKVIVGAFGGYGIVKRIADGNGSAPVPNLPPTV